MGVLLDSLVMLLADPSASTQGDSMTVTLRRVRDGKERIYEATVGAHTFLSIVRALASLFPPAPPHGTAEIVRMNLIMWTSSIDPQCRAVWH